MVGPLLDGFGFSFSIASVWMIKDDQRVQDYRVNSTEPNS